MELETFLKRKPDWAYEPALYIVKQTDSINAYRCGLAGSQLHQDIDRVFGSERESNLTGLLSRMSMYNGFWQPLRGKIYAALRIRKQLVAKQSHRLGTDFVGNQFNANHGNFTLVRAREADMHAEMDRRGLRWDKNRKNELFVPKQSVQELIAVMRTIPGEEMFLFDQETIKEDPNYRWNRIRTGARISNVIETQYRRLPVRDTTLDQRAPTVVIKLTKQEITP